MSNPYLKDDNSYYYGYGYNAGGYDYGGYDSGSHRTIKDYLVIFRERIWFFIPALFLFVVGSFLYTINETPSFRAATTIQVLREDPRILKTQDIESSDIRGPEDLNTQIQLMESKQIIQLVDQRLQGAIRAKFLKPYEGGDQEERELSVLKILAENRTIQPVRSSFVVALFYDHPDPKIAAAVANMFVEEYIRFNMRQSLGISNKAVEDLRRRASEQRERVKSLEMQLAQYKEEKRSVSIDADENIAKQEIQRLNDLVITHKSEFDYQSSRIEQIEKAMEAENSLKELQELPFIASNPTVMELRSAVSANKIEIARLSQRYREKHPQMIQAEEALKQSEAELKQAIQSAVEEIRSNYRQASRSYAQSRERLEAQEKNLIKLGKDRVEYNAIESELQVEKTFYQALVSRMTQELAQTELQSSQIRVIDPAVEPGRPHKPNMLLNMAIGSFLGLTSGLGLVFLVAFLDDRVKTAYDVESEVGLPLIGIVPRLKKLDASEKARVVATETDRHVVESFRTIHSSLRLGEDSKNAKVILTTSTIPGEGKTFVCTNLAATLASHGEKTLLLDGDLRLPNIGKSLQIEADVGMVNYFEENLSLDDVILHDFIENLDIIPSGAKAKNPTRIINNPRFAELINQLKERYDKIVIDSPPLAAVSDALNLLPLVDGVIYVIKFNAVKQKTAKLNVKRLWDSSTPVFGAVMNNIGNKISSYYYSHYYNRSYQDYYSRSSTDESEPHTGDSLEKVGSGKSHS